MGKPKSKRKQHFQPRFKGDTFAKQRGIKLRIAEIEAKLDQPKFRLYREARDTNWSDWWYSGLKRKEVANQNAEAKRLAESEQSRQSQTGETPRRVSNLSQKKARGRKRNNSRGSRSSQRYHSRV